MHYGTSCESFLGHALCLGKKSAHAVDLTSKIVLAGAEYCATYFYGIGKTRQDGVYLNRVAIGYLET